VPYGDDITEGIPYVLSNPAGSTAYVPTGPAYEVAFSGLPFFIAASDEQPYRRVTAQYRKQQVDQTREPGEQTLTGWWVRSQSSFHLGAGIKYFEPIQEESLRFQYTESKGIDVWTRGQATLLNDTASFYSGAAPAQMIGVNDGTNDCILVTDGTALKKITTGGTSSTYTQTGTASTIHSLTTNGKQYFFVNGSTVHRGNISGSTSDTEIYTAASTTRATIRYVKQRLIAAIGSSIYELDPNNSSGALPTALFTHPNSSWVWSSIAEGPQAIYISGYDPNGTSSSVFKIGLDDTPANKTGLGFPGLLTPTVIIDMPFGERINDFDVYLGTYAVLATSAGFRIGLANATGDIQYGPLLFKDAPCNAIAFKDSFAYISTLVDGEAGLVRTDLSTTVIANDLYFPWAWDLVATTSSATITNLAIASGTVTVTTSLTHGLNVGQVVTFSNTVAPFTAVTGTATILTVPSTTTFTVLIGSSTVASAATTGTVTTAGTSTTASQVAFFGNSDRLTFSTGNDIWAESTTNLVSTGYLRTGYIRYNTLETKIYKLLQARIDTANGGIAIESIDSRDNTYNIGTFSQGTTVPEINVNYPTTSQEYLGFQFTMIRSSTDASKGPLFTGYQLKSLPAVPRQRLIQYPVFCYDHESDKFGNEIGFEGSAYQRMSQLESIENVGDTIRVQDFRTGEEYLGIIEEMDFMNKTPEDKRFSGFGGTLLVTIRTI
jgi:hypothetical protein